MSLIIWLGDYFQIRFWDLHPAHLQAFWYLFGSIWGCPDAPKQPKNNNSSCFGLTTKMGFMIWLGAYFQA
jgi:hypothetical protein